MFIFAFNNLPNILRSKKAHAIQGEVVMCEGLPVSDRAGHGYGCRSMQAIAARRGGLFELQAENGVFLLRLALPLNG